MPPEAKIPAPGSASGNADLHCRRNGVRMVIGASRGIGLALVAEQLRNSRVTRVIATHRPSSDLRGLKQLAHQFGERLWLQKLDVTSPASLEQLAQYAAKQPGGIDLMIHAAGILHTPEVNPERSLEQCESRNLMHLFQVNAIGPLMTARALLPSLHRNRPFTFACLSAMVGSIGDNRLGGWYGYRASKTALNQFLKTLANECRFRHPAGSVVAIHPGTTDTDLSKPFQSNVAPGKLYSPRQTAKRLLSVLETLDAGQSGQFLNWDGSIIPW